MLDGLPLPVVSLAELPGVSTLTLFYKSTLLDPGDITAIFSLALPAFLVDRTYLEGFQIDPLLPGWNEFGISGLAEDGTHRLGERLRVGAQTWILHFSWNGSHSAWGAFLQTQDTLDHPPLSLLPPLLLPSLVMARVADRYRVEGRTNESARWTSRVAQAERRLSPLIAGFYLHWLNGSSEAARLYSSQEQTDTELTPLQSLLLDRWERLFGRDMLDILSTTERVESTITRGLEEASTHLWSDRSLPIPGQLLHFASALLPLAQWPLNQVVPTLSIPDDQRSLGALQKAWQAWKAEEA